MLTLKDFLLAVASGGIAIGPVLYALINYTNWLKALDPRLKRIAVIVLAGLIAVLARYLAARLGYTPDLTFDSTNIAEAFWSQSTAAALAAFGSSTILHGFTLKKPPETL